MDIALITLAVMAAMIAAVLLLWPPALRYFARKYYQQAYQPVVLTGNAGPPLPPEAHLSNVPWIASPWPLGHSTSLQMIAASRGIEYPRENFDFLMALTYGASSMPGLAFTPLGADPEIGLLTAAPYLGMKRVYSVTNDPARFQMALQAAIAGGTPVRLAVDEGALYGGGGFESNSVVLVGYDPEHFYYYEPVGRSPAPVEPGLRPAGEAGLPVTGAVLAEAVKAMSRRMGYPWQYALTTFEPAPLQEDLRPLWLLNGKAMADEVKYGPRAGARAVEDLALKIERSGVNADLSKVRDAVDLAALLRAENARFLRANFSQNYDLLEAAGLLEQAARFYGQVRDDLADGIHDPVEARRVSSWLMDAAAAERRTGEIFIKRASLPI